MTPADTTLAEKLCRLARHDAFLRLNHAGYNWWKVEMRDQESAFFIRSIDGATLDETVDAALKLLEDNHES